MNTNIKTTHTFQIDGMEIQISVERFYGRWSSSVLKGNSGCAGSYGGDYKTLKEYISAQEKEHAYCYYFFKYGYAAAKASISS